MAIIGLHQVKTSGQFTDAEKIGNELYKKSLERFTQVLGQRNLGLSYLSCNAAVAINSNAIYDSVRLDNGNQFSVVYGSSRLFTGLDNSFNAFHQNIAPQGRTFSNSNYAEHAEQSAIRVVENLNLGFWADPTTGNNHIYIDLTPCDICTPWLRNHTGNWHVHYYTQLNEQGPIIKQKKQTRKEEFGRQMEPNKRQRQI